MWVVSNGRRLALIFILFDEIFSLTGNYHLRDDTRTRWGVQTLSGRQADRLWTAVH